MTSNPRNVLMAMKLACATASLPHDIFTQDSLELDSTLAVRAWPCRHVFSWNGLFSFMRILTASWTTIHQATSCPLCRERMLVLLPCFGEEYCQQRQALPTLDVAESLWSGIAPLKKDEETLPLLPWGLLPNELQQSLQAYVHLATLVHSWPIPEDAVLQESSLTTLAAAAHDIVASMSQHPPPRLIDLRDVNRLPLQPPPMNEGMGYLFDYCFWAILLSSGTSLCLIVSILCYGIYSFTGFMLDFCL